MPFYEYYSIVYSYLAFFSEEYGIEDIISLMMEFKQLYGNEKRNHATNT